MKNIDSNLQCPSCHGPLRPKILGCDDCGVQVEGPFQFNEFALLEPDDLHFLRIFVQSEGRVRDMESALGLSYPTIRSRLSTLKTKLGGAPGLAPLDAAKSETTSVRATLDRLAAGKITFDEAMKTIKKTRI